MHRQSLHQPLQQPQNRRLLSRVVRSRHHCNFTRHRPAWFPGRAAMTAAAAASIPAVTAPAAVAAAAPVAVAVMIVTTGGKPARGRLPRLKRYRGVRRPRAVTVDAARRLLLPVMVRVVPLLPCPKGPPPPLGTYERNAWLCCRRQTLLRNCSAPGGGVAEERGQKIVGHVPSGTCQLSSRHHPSPQQC